MRIQVRIGLQHPLVWCKTTKRRRNGIAILDEIRKTEVPCHSRCGTIKIPPCSKALSTEHRPKFCSPSLVTVTIILLHNEGKILAQNVKTVNNQSNEVVSWDLSDLITAVLLVQ
jgi:hypothetical protein